MSKISDAILDTLLETITDYRELDLDKNQNIQLQDICSRWEDKESIESEINEYIYSQGYRYDAIENVWYNDNAKSQAMEQNMKINVNLTQIKQSMKLLITDLRQMKKLYPKLNKNQNYPKALQLLLVAGYDEHFGAYNTAYLRIQPKNKKVFIIHFYSDFDMTYFTFNKFFKKGCKEDDIEIQQKFLNMLYELREVGIIDVDLGNWKLTEVRE